MAGEDQFGEPMQSIKLCLLLAGIKVGIKADYEYNKQWGFLTEIFLNSFLYYFNLVVLHTVIFSEIYWVVDGIMTGRDFVVMSLTVPCITISILGTLKAIPLYFRRDVVKNIIDTLKEIHPESLNDATVSVHENQIDGDGNLSRNEGKRFREISEDINDRNVNELYASGDFLAADDDGGNFEKKVVDEAVQMLKMVEFMLSWISASVLFMFLLAPLLSMYWRYFKTGVMEIMYPFSVKYWFDAYDVTLWPLIYFHQVWATIIVAVSIYGTETLFYAICTYIEMHFRILRHRFENIRPGSPRVQEHLIANIRKHQLLIHLVKMTESLFSVPLLVHIVSSSFLICLSAFNITVAEDLGSVLAFITFLMLSLSQVSLLCFFGDKLMRSSTEVSSGIYRCPWYDFDVNVKKTVFIIIMKSQKPCKLTASNFADINLRAFTTILSRSWSYFALLKTVYK